jgi:hypothetical protein
MASKEQQEGLEGTKHQVVFAPHRPELVAGRKTIFLAGTTTPTGEPDWRETLSAGLSAHPVTIFNPFRSDWGWAEDLSDPRFKEQVEWELDMQEQADIITVYFHPITLAPISLLELGLCARSGKAIVVCPGGPDGYQKRGNVQAVCARYGLELVQTVEELLEAVVRRLGTDG